VRTFSLSLSLSKRNIISIVFFKETQLLLLYLYFFVCENDDDQNYSSSRAISLFYHRDREKCARRRNTFRVDSKDRRENLRFSLSRSSKESKHHRYRSSAVSSRGTSAKERTIVQRVHDAAKCLFLRASALHVHEYDMGVGQQPKLRSSLSKSNVRKLRRYFN